MASIITMPKLATEKALSPEAPKEWKRFLVKVLVHENGNVIDDFEVDGNRARTLAFEGEEAVAGAP